MKEAPPSHLSLPPSRRHYEEGRKKEGRPEGEKAAAREGGREGWREREERCSIFRARLRSLLQTRAGAARRGGGGEGGKEGRIWSMESRRGEVVCGIRGLIYFHNVQSWATPLADTVGIGQGFRTSPARSVFKHAV